ncbi:hypothetical protein SAHY_14483 [Salinisphaera hydrothermalis EPR70]
MSSDDQNASDEFVDVHHIMARYQISRPTVWRWTKDGLLPKPMRFSPSVTRWRLSDLIAREAEVREA